ncbi:MAG: HlyD family efflux transporter periplasmic adaptor subunit [Pseudomonadota bacterium]
MTRSNDQREIAPPPKAIADLWRAGIVIATFVGAALVWAIAAPIATTLRVNGEIASANPSHSVQDTTGGRIQAVHVELYDRIATGDLLFTFDRTEDRLKQAALQQRAGLLRAELREIAARLDEGVEDKSGTQNYVARVFEERDAIVETRLALGRSQIDAAIRQHDLLSVEISANENLRAQLEKRLKKSRQLAASGYLTETELERLNEVLMELDVELAGQASEREAVTAEIASLHIQNDLTKSEHVMALAEQRSQNERELIGIEAELRRIAYTIERSEVRATADGMVTSLAFSTSGSVASPGAVLAVISLPLANPMLQLKVPTKHIDQVAPGQKGELTVASLPARGTPAIAVILRSIAEEPVKDREGAALYYLAEATISAEDIKTARQKMGPDFQLVLGMPVSVALDGNTVKFWDFLTGPLLGIWETAFAE